MLATHGPLKSPITGIRRETPVFRGASLAFMIEAALAALTAGLGLVTMVSREWIELLFGVDPDGGSGTLEWAIVGILLVLSLTFSAMARARWVRDIAGAR